MAETKVYIDQITFNDGNIYNFNHSDIVVFTGANNSGKSQVLRDIKNFFANKNTTRVIANDIKACYEGNLQTLKDECINKNGQMIIKSGLECSDEEEYCNEVVNDIIS